MISAKSNRQAAKFGFSFGLGWFGAGISWVHVAIADFGGIPILASLFLMLLLVSYLALFPALAAYLSLRFNKRLGLWAIVPAWLVAEWIRSWLFTGFPWLSIGYSQVNSPLSGFAPVIGEFGIQALVIAISTLVLFKPFKRSVFVIAVLFIAGFSLQQYQWTTHTGKTVSLALVQGNIQQSVKWQPDNEVPTMSKYLNMTIPHLQEADLIIWPEAAIPRLEILANDFLVEVDRLASESNTAVLTGIVDFQPDTNFAFNNIIALGKKQSFDQFGHYKYLDNNRYNKHHLLPIGEYVPFEFILRELAPIFDLPMSSFSRGSYQQSNLIANGLNISPAICFEIAFSAQIRANLYDDSDFILTISNDAWFGDSHGPWQHLQIAQMRALEFAKPVVRVTNNGITAVINEQGKLQSVLKQNEADVLSTTLNLSSSNTFYQRYGDLFIILLVSFITFFLIFTNKHKMLKNRF